MKGNVAVIGIGKLGLCFALNAERGGYFVTGIDVSNDYVRSLNDKSFSSPEPMVNEYLAESKNFRASTDIYDALQANLLFVMVATPAKQDFTYDHLQIERIAEQLMKLGKQENTKHLVIGCTTMPGYCDTLAEKLAPYNYTLSYNPEFIAQGSIIRNQQFPDQILIGEANEQVGEMIAEVHHSFCHSKPQVCRMDRLSAEITKLATNCFLTTKISFANSIGDLAVRAGADVERILSAIGSDSRIGNKYLNYGFGYGGPCFPRDNRALIAFAQTIGASLPIASATDAVNEEHLQFQLQQYLNTYLPHQPILLEGVTYKKGTVFIDESQQLRLALLLVENGRKVIVKERIEVIEQLRILYGDIFEYIIHS